jgi:hypothetical protein
MLWREFFFLDYDVYGELFFSYFFGYCNLTIFMFQIFYFNIAMERSIHRTGASNAEEIIQNTLVGIVVFNIFLLNNFQF